MTTKSNVAVVQRFFQDVYNDGNTAVIPELVTEGYRDYGHVPPGEGYEGAIADAGGVRSVFSDVHYVLDDVVAAGDKVAVRWSGSMAHTGAAPGFPAPTGRVAHVTGMSIYDFENGKISATHNQQDFAGLLAQLSD